jgi:hypothetical protein
MVIAIISGPEDGRVSECDEEPIVLGRHGTLQLADHKVSKRHAQLRCDGGEWYIEDMGSRNGTYVNGDRVDRPRRVSEGDKLALGMTVMVISRLAPAPRPGAAPPPADEASQTLPPPENTPPSSPDTPPAEDALATPSALRANSLYLPEIDSDPLAAWTITLPERREPERRNQERALAAQPDEAILSIRPLAHQELPATTAFSRRLPYLILTLVLVAIVANIALVIMFSRDARRDVQELRSALENRDQTTAEMIVQEVRDELRAPSAQQLQAWQELRDGLSAKQDIFNEKLRDDLAARDAVLLREGAAREKTAARGEAERGQTDIARELAEIKEAIAALRQASASTGSAAPLARTEAQNASAPVPPSSPEGATLATNGSVPVTAPQAAVEQVFLIDASAALERAIPAAAAEVRRVLRDTPPRGAARVLLLYQGRLMELQPAALNSPEGAETIDHGPADLSKALTVAMADHPRALHLLSETLGDLPEAVRIIDGAGGSATRIDITQFFSRKNREELKAVARDHRGTYTFVSAAN